MKRVPLSLLWLLAAASLGADDYPRNPGLDVTHYAFRLELSDETDEILAEAEVAVRFLVDAAPSLQLDLVGGEGAPGMTVTGVHEDGAPVPYVHEGDRIRILPPSPGRAREVRSYTIRYRGIPGDGLVVADNRHGDRTFSADNWPNKTRHWLPTVDHPYDKATCEFLITAPDRYQVVANGFMVEETDLPGGLRLTHWRESVPISSWLMVISVGRYAVQYLDGYQGISIQTWVFPQDREAGFFDFARARWPLEFFSTYVGPYAYEKLANVQVTAPVGATEAASSVLYQQDFVTGERRRENVIAHEIAHHWFGNSVTEDDWDDVWLSEGFATYLTLLFVEHAYGRDAFVEGLRRSREVVFAFHEENPDYRIVHANLEDMSAVTTRNTYQKGAWVLHMLRGIMGDEAFRAGIREYYRRFRDRNASTDDFRGVMEELHGEDLRWFFRQWLYRGGRLELDGEWSYDQEEQMLRLELRQTQPDGILFRMPIPIGIDAGQSTGLRIEIVQVDEREHRFSIALEDAPVSVALDPDTWVLMRGKLRKEGQPGR